MSDIKQEILDKFKANADRAWEESDGDMGSYHLGRARGFDFAIMFINKHLDGKVIVPENVAWHDLKLGETIRPGDRCCRPGEWFIFEDEHLSFSNTVGPTSHPVQRLLSAAKEEK